MSKRKINRNYQDLERIYHAEGNGKMNATFEHRKSASWKRITFFLFLLLVAASTAAWLGFYAFTSLQIKNSGTLTLHIVAPTEVSVGSSITYRFVISNQSSDAVQNLHLRANYPSGFLWHSATISPEGNTNNTWSVASIAAGETKEVDVSGTLLGETGSLGTVFATLTYKLQNFQSELQTSDSVSTALISGSQSLIWEGDAQVVPGKETTYILHYANKGSEALPPTIITVSGTDGFTVTSTAPSIDLGGSLKWPLAALPAGEEGKIEIIGNWKETTTGEHTLSASLEATGDHGNKNVITSAELTVTAVGGEALMTLTVNGEQNQPVASLGDTLHFNLHYENISDVSLGDLTVRVAFDGGVVNWPQVTVPDGSVDAGAISWSSKELPLLSRLVPGGSGDLNWDIPLKNSVSGGTRLSLTISPTLHYEKRDDSAASGDIQGAVTKVSINTALTVNAIARYFADDGTPVGSGPLPPHAGSDTTYRITWKLSGSVHPLTNVVVTAALPNNVTLGSGFASNGTWTNSSGTPQWTIGSLSPGLEPEANFTVTLHPTESDAGKIVVLENKIAMQAIDEVTKGQVSGNGNAVTTNLEGDPVASGKGIVAAP
ncbi:hypothetical protein COV04_00580 [Candidatus Uhrbacteria bacterium CG10_big_fil_rev_8_21_14_0_10_48_11]|uniref:DUF11 domain-containing protein n=1 Tax=Candidatus Uhrbacteria bacterium CG10_big_fil_rev_8_21_14_0_10_48_11 TaxID=1975037 RepID=A0A2M8LFJ9_9BACT|nr:MAG: hypothetical protein COV04_00580 [Candidatus Uhrbacteria bacterium CG10_big_fil_rev_8_21_14_0_10_48_11]